jgi:superfamily II DNA helicase RecQ
MTLTPTQIQDIIHRLELLEARVETLSRRQMERFGGSPDTLNEEDAALFEKLKEWRKKRAAELSVPVYVVIPDEALAVLAATKPTGLHLMGSIKGMGPKRIESYGDEVLAVIQSQDG